MLLDVASVAALLAIGNVLFWHFDPRLSLWKRAMKVLVALAVTAVLSYFFGHLGAAIGFVLAILPVVYVHAFWLPRHGVNGWTGEPREKYYALRGWAPPD